MAKLLLLEDDLILQEIIEEYLLEQKYSVDTYYNGEEALSAAMSGQYDMLLLDVNVPEIDGFELLEYLREIKNTTPAIFITSLSSIKNLQKGFELGANDYLKKPFDLEELSIRIKHQLDSMKHEEVVEFGKFRFHPKLHYVYHENTKIALKHKEVQILLYFLRQEGRVISFDELIENIWKQEKLPTQATIRTYIKNLRKALGSDSIENIKGAGYRFNII